jgi:hypothetical protein
MGVKTSLSKCDNDKQEPENCVNHHRRGKRTHIQFFFHNENSHRFSFTCRMLFGFLVDFIALVCVPLINQQTLLPPTANLCITLGLASLTGILKKKREIQRNQFFIDDTSSLLRFGNCNCLWNYNECCCSTPSSVYNCCHVRYRFFLLNSLFYLIISIVK